ncbi:hypothetical protein CK203_077212 [Vitis vinifera]|uniref:Uncharacterized protein n=1 Tax=Vitis vinifera TaxID=29760 RepID=A0A438BUM0_VITVI|nr:hypothetical protein CK203_077212 [Vitis vinifera]
MYEHDMILIMLIVEYFVSDVMHACTHVLSTAGKRSVATATRFEAKEEDQVDDWIGGCLGAYAVLHTGSIGCAMATWMSLLIEDF